MFVPCVLIFCNALTNTKTTFVECETLEHNSKQMWTPLRRCLSTYFYTYLYELPICYRKLSNMNERFTFIHFPAFHFIMTISLMYLTYWAENFAWFVFFFLRCTFHYLKFSTLFLCWVFLVSLLFAFIFHATKWVFYVSDVSKTTTRNVIHCVDEEICDKRCKENLCVAHKVHNFLY